MTDRLKIEAFIRTKLVDQLGDYNDESMLEDLDVVVFADGTGAITYKGTEVGTIRDYWAINLSRVAQRIVGIAWYLADQSRR